MKITRRASFSGWTLRKGSIACGHKRRAFFQNYDAPPQGRGQGQSQRQAQNRFYWNRGHSTKEATCRPCVHAHHLGTTQRDTVDASAGAVLRQLPSKTGNVPCYERGNQGDLREELPKPNDVPSGAETSRNVSFSLRSKD